MLYQISPVGRSPPRSIDSQPPVLDLRFWILGFELQSKFTI
ncbi:MAG: hypothetical protein ACRC62_23270 [Microcoleus sp.]